uniref:Uncharacterized protein n=1 Tax=Anguilla anguilla TaxID=7936 RepID=A0A0E9TPD7_ANGAN
MAILKTTLCSSLCGTAECIRYWKALMK